MGGNFLIGRKWPEIEISKHFSALTDNIIDYFGKVDMLRAILGIGQYAYCPGNTRNALFLGQYQYCPAKARAIRVMPCF
jgi:hypothetical protein